MKPQLKISKVVSLQDARYAAAKGFDYISFSLLRGDMRKLSVEMIWNIINWIEGPQIAIELDRQSLEEFEEAKVRFSIHYLELPISDLAINVREMPDIIWKISADEGKAYSVEDLLLLLQKSKGVQRDVLFEFIANDLDVLSSLKPIFPHLLLGFSSLALFESYINSSKGMSSFPLGFSFGEEAEEETGILDYQRVDEILEKVGIN